MIRAALLAVLLWPAAARAATSPLVGTWMKDGAVYSEVRADGTGRVHGQNVRWKADAKTLSIFYPSGEVEVMSWKIAGKTLTVTMGGQSDVMTRGGGKAAAAPAATKAGGDKLSKLLLSSPWCSFTYNKISGSSHQERVVFRADGTWGSGARGESYSSGQYGTVAGQTDSASGGRWQVKSGELWLASGGEPLQNAGLTVTQNSNGYPILKTGNKEYSSCR